MIGFIVLILMLLLSTGIEWIRNLVRVRTLKKIALLPRDILTNLPYTLKPAVVKLREQGIPIYAEWDAGGDSLCCSVKVGDKWGYEQNGNEISSRLADLIAQQLCLPHNGESYNKGHGTIDINQEGQVVLCYSCCAHTSEYEGDMDSNSVTFIDYIKLIDDPFGLHPYVHRVAITFSMYMHLDSTDVMCYQVYENWIQVRIWEGDELPQIRISEKMKEFYLNVLKKRLQVYEKDFRYTDKTVGQKIVTSINIAGRLEVSGIHLEVNQWLDRIDDIKTNETIVLLD